MYEAEHGPPADDLIQLRELYDDACRDRDEAKRQVRKLTRSLSWRATSPLRRAAKALQASGRWLRLAAQNAKTSEQVPGVPGQKCMSENAFLEYLAGLQAQNRPVFVQLTPMDWDVPLFQRPQHMSAAMARMGAVSVFSSSEVRGARSPVSELRPDTWLVNNRELLQTLKGSVVSFYSTDSDTRISYIEKLRANNRIVYEYVDCIDGEIFGYEKIPTLQRMQDYAFSGGADLVVASARALYDEAVMAAGPGRTLLVPNGVDYSHFGPLSWRHEPYSDQMVAFKQRYPIVAGYFGALASWLWYEAINELTAMRPDIGFVFIGPNYFTGKHQIIARKNVLLTGAVPYTKLPSYAGAFDMCMIPFRPGEIAQTTSPLKLFEYFAMEKPVAVTSDMTECVQFPEVVGADSAEGFSRAIDQCLALSGSVHFRGRLRALALENTWDKRAQTILAAARK